MSETLTGESKGLLLIIADLFFLAKLKEAAKSLRYESTGAANADIALKRLRELRPLAVILSLNKEGFDWERFLTEARANDATKDVPILAFGSHVDTAAFKRAAELGADMTAPNSQVSAQFDYLLYNLLEP